ncbi:MAG: type II CAAX endopeptidase family protein [Bacilli bacterium]
MNIEQKKVKNKIPWKEVLFKLIPIGAYFVLMFTSWWQRTLYKLVLSSVGSEISSLIINLIVFLLVLILAILFEKKMIYQSTQEYNKKNAKTIFKEALIALLICFLANIIGSLISSFFSNASTSVNQTEVNNILGGTYGILFIPIITIIGPIVEELVFRGGILDGLVKVKVPSWIAVLLSAALFGFIHVSAGDYSQIFSYLFMGIALGAIYVKTKSIYTSIITHILINSISVSLFYLATLAESILSQIQ